MTLVYINNLPQLLDAQSLESILSQTTEYIKCSKIKESNTNLGNHVILKFANDDSAILAINRLNNLYLTFNNVITQIKAKWCIPQIQKYFQNGNESSIMVFNIPEDHTETNLRQIFSHFGRIVYVQIVQSSESPIYIKKYKNYQKFGYVLFLQKTAVDNTIQNSLKFNKSQNFIVQQCDMWMQRKLIGFHKNIRNDKELYIGQHKNGNRNGLGKLIFANNDIFEGNFQNNKRNGYGQYSELNGNYNQNYYINDQRQGYGCEQYINNDNFIGEYRSNCRNGLGIYQLADGNRYVGLYKDGLRHGFGVYQNGDGSYQYCNYSIQFPNQWCINSQQRGCRVVAELQDKCYYQQLQGYCKCLYSDGSIFIGYFENNIKNGFGIHYQLNGERFLCNYKNGLKRGYDSHVYNDGTIEIQNIDDAYENKLIFYSNGEKKKESTYYNYLNQKNSITVSTNRVILNNLYKYNQLYENQNNQIYYDDNIGYNQQNNVHINYADNQNFAVNQDYYYQNNRLNQGKPIIHLNDTADYEVVCYIIISVFICIVAFVCFHKVKNIFQNLLLEQDKVEVKQVHNVSAEIVGTAKQDMSPNESMPLDNLFNASSERETFIGFMVFVVIVCFCCCK